MNIRRASQVTTAAIVLVSLLALGAMLAARQAWTVSRQAYEARLQMLAYTDRLAGASDHLSDTVRAYATTGQRRHFDDFQRAVEVDVRRPSSVDDLTRMGFDPAEQELVARARGKADRLVELARQAVASVDGGQPGEAIRIVYGPEYAAAKAAVMEPIAEARHRLEKRLADHAAALADRGQILNDLALLALLTNAVIVLAVLVLLYQRRVVRPLGDLDASLRALIARKEGAAIGHQDDRSEIGDLARSIEQYRLTVAEADRQRWVKTSLAELSGHLQATEQPADLAAPLLSVLVPLLGGGCAALSLRAEADGRFHIAGAYGLQADQDHPPFAPGEGVAGQAAAERRRIALTDLPEGYLRIGSALGAAPPRHLTAMPVLTADTVLAVLEIATFHALTPPQSALLDEVAPLVAQRLDALQRAMRTRQLLDQVQASEAELRHINFLADSALDLTKAGYWHVPLDGSGWYNSSERAARIFGDLPAPGHRYPIADWSANVFAGDQEAAEATMAHFNAAIAGTIPVYDSTYAYRRPVDGRVVWIHALGHVVKNAQGEPTDIYGVTQDITDFKTLEIDLIAARRHAEAATKMKSMFLANMSHEIRTPMNAIIGLSNLALRTPLSAKQRDYLNKIHNAGTALLAIINDILDFSKIEAGRLSLESTDFRLDEVIDTVVTVTGQKAHEKGLEFLADIATAVPPDLRGDPLRLGQILTNLVSNAVKFTEQGEVHLRAELLERIGDKCQLRFSVRDTGIGMTQEQSERLFQPFTQGDMSTTRKHGGTGLGLTICRRLVELMGGQIWLDSVPDAGTTLWFTVWLEVGEGTDSATVLPQRLASLRVLVADDNPAANEIIEAALRPLVQQVRAVDSGLDALAAVQAMDASQPFDVVFLDWRMPRMDGLEAARRIRADETLQHQPAIVLVTAYGREEVREEAEHLHLDGYLLKPLTRSMLVDSLMNVLGPDGASAPPADSARRGQRLPGLRVLLVEDNEINQQIAVELLEGDGAHVDLAHNGCQALERLLSGATYDLVLMDLQMPEMDGYEATERIRAEHRLAGLPIIAMTAHATTEERQRCLAAGMNDHVSKPIDPTVLISTLTRYWQPPGGVDTDTPAVMPEAPPGDDGLDAIDGLDTAPALARMGGNRTLYRQLLRQFLEMANAAELIERQLADGDRLAAERTAHTVRGVAANLGATAVQACATDLEQALHTASTPRDALFECLSRFRGELADMVARLRAALPESPLADDGPTQAPDPAQLAEVVRRLDALLAQFDAGASDCFAAQRSLFQALFAAEELQAFESFLARFELSDARRLLRQVAIQREIELS